MHRSKVIYKYCGHRTIHNILCVTGIKYGHPDILWCEREKARARAREKKYREENPESKLKTQYKVI